MSRPPILPQVRQQVWIRAGLKCEVCQSQTAPPGWSASRAWLQIHHIKPYREEKAHDPENLQLLCHECHKLDKTHGRPRLPEGEKQVTVGLRFPPALWDRLTRVVGPRKRAQFIHEAVAEKLDGESVPTTPPPGPAEEQL